MPKLPEDLNPIRMVGRMLRGGMESVEGALRDIDEVVAGMDREVTLERSEPPAPEDRASDEETLRYQLEKLLSSLRQLEIHLSEGCRIGDG